MSYRYSTGRRRYRHERRRDRHVTCLYDVVHLCNDIVLDIGLEHQVPESMSYDVVNDMRAGRYSPDFMSYDVVNDISHVYFDIVLHWNDIDLDM